MEFNITKLLLDPIANLLSNADCIRAEAEAILFETSKMLKKAFENNNTIKALVENGECFHWLTKKDFVHYINEIIENAKDYSRANINAEQANRVEFIKKCFIWALQKDKESSDNPEYVGAIGNLGAAKLNSSGGRI